jgi:hypothetical protein
MDGERFDRVAAALAAGRSRRRTVVGLVGAVLAATLGPPSTAAQAIDAAGCRQRLARCDRREQCCEAEGNNLGCADVSQECRRSRAYPGERCCGRDDATCTDSCACCRGYVCRSGRCQQLGDGVCLETTCCGCFRCNAEECVFDRCVTALTFRECIDRCGPGIDLIEGISGPGTTFDCVGGGRCRVKCQERRDAPRATTTERWRAAPGG